LGMSSPRGSSPSPPARGREWQRTAETSSSKRPAPQESSVVPPPAKRAKLAKQEAPFCDGFVLGSKPKASDYVPVVRAILLRACTDYSGRIITINALPSVGLQGEWAKQTFRAACRAADERYILSPRMAKIIVARGSQVRGKLVEIVRTLFAPNYEFARSTNVKTIAANKEKAELLLHKSAAHYKDPTTRAGYAENKIIGEVRQLVFFKERTSVGIIFSSYFDPIPFPLIALEITTLEFCAKEWQTGTFSAAKFTEKSIAEAYAGHLADTEKWSKLNEAVVDKLRRKWYVRASRPVTKITSTDKAGNMDEEQQNALRDELAGRTGDTDSE
ncbi:hypothetical protein GGX14DRAFT_322821, partial [Mycena pura]